MDFSTLNWVDYAIITIIGVSVLVSFVRGFIKEALSLGNWVIALWAAITFSKPLSSVFDNYISTPQLSFIAAFSTLFFSSLFLGGMLSYLLSTLIRKTGLGGTDRVIGLAFGIVRGVLVISVMLLIASLTSMPNQPWWTDSTLIPQFSPISQWLLELFPENLLDNLF